MSFFQLLFYLGFIQGIIFSLVILFKGAKKVNTKLLSAFVFITAWGCLFDDTVNLQINPLVYWLWNGNQLLIGPLFYLYIVYFDSNETRLEQKDYWHFLLFVLLKLLAFPIEVFGFSTDFLEPITFISGLVPSIHILAYMIASLVVIKKLNYNLFDFFSEEGAGSIAWLSYIALITISATVFVLVFKLLDSIIFYQIAYLMAVFSIYLLSVKSITYPFFFFEHSGSVSNGEKDTSEKKYANSPIPRPELEIYAEKAVQCLKGERLYLNPNLNLSQLAEHSGIPHHLLTQSINQILEKNFYQLVNELRVEEFKGKVSKPESDQFTLLTLALESGFKTKSSFNRIFKELTNTTPSAFRKDLRP